MAITYREREDAAREVADALAAEGRRAAALRVDAGDRRALRALVEDVRAELGEIDILVNNAGMGAKREVEAITDEDWTATSPST